MAEKSVQSRQSGSGDMGIRNSLSNIQKIRSGNIGQTTLVVVMIRIKEPRWITVKNANIDGRHYCGDWERGQQANRKRRDKNRMNSESLTGGIRVGDRTYREMYIRVWQQPSLKHLVREVGDSWRQTLFRGRYITVILHFCTLRVCNGFPAHELIQLCGRTCLIPAETQQRTVGN
jgi:hypothetical protein